jgi:preprotein translocase subunit YajC
MAGDSLQPGDWVRTNSGLIGKIVVIVRLTAFVDIQQQSGFCSTVHVLSELVKIDAPTFGNEG